MMKKQPYYCTLFLFFVLLFAASPQAYAEKADRNQPTHLSANKSLKINDLTQTQVFEGDAVLTKGTIRISAERLEFRQDREGYQYASAISVGSKLARFRQKREGVDQFVEGQAERIEFDGKADTVTFINQAIVRTTDLAGKVIQEVKGAKLSYDNKTETSESLAGKTSSGNQGRVEVFIAPRTEPLAPANSVNSPSEPKGGAK